MNALFHRISRWFHFHSSFFFFNCFYFTNFGQRVFWMALNMLNMSCIHVFVIRYLFFLLSFSLCFSFKVKTKRFTIAVCILLVKASNSVWSVNKHICILDATVRFNANVVFSVSCALLFSLFVFVKWKI